MPLFSALTVSWPGAALKMYATPSVYVSVASALGITSEPTGAL